MATVPLLLAVALAFVASAQANIICKSGMRDLAYRFHPLNNLQAGDEITVYGTMASDAKQAFLNLYLGTGPVWEHADVSLHYRIDYLVNYIIYNSYTVAQGKWGPEETSSLRFGRGQKFTTTVQLTDNGYNIIINGAFAYHYHYRDNYRAVGALYFYGDWNIERYEIRCRGPVWGTSIARNTDLFEYLEGYGYGTCPLNYEWFDEI